MSCVKSGVFTVSIIVIVGIGAAIYFGVNSGMGTWVAVGLIAFWIIRAYVEIQKEHADRELHPEKWKKIDAQRAKDAEQLKVRQAIAAELREERELQLSAKNYWVEYQAAMVRAPRSEWIVLTRLEKASVFRRREKLKEAFYALPLKTQQLIISMYNVDTNFPDSI
jgi:hypothetical protein